VRLIAAPGAPCRPRSAHSVRHIEVVAQASPPCITAGVCAFSMALVVTQRVVDRQAHVSDPALTTLWPPRQKLWTARSCTARHGFPKQGQF
jgi:hypothetical protein